MKINDILRSEYEIDKLWIVKLAKVKKESGNNLLDEHDLGDFFIENFEHRFKDLVLPGDYVRGLMQEGRRAYISN